MRKKFLEGLIFGAGFAVAFLAVVAAVVYIGLPLLIGRETTVVNLCEGDDCGGSIPPEIGPKITLPPALMPPAEFVGSTGTYSNGFDPSTNPPVLAAGPGRIVGRVRVDGKPLEGLTLRLALNGKAFSQWATSGADGRYEIAVPYGAYRVDGHELDMRSANAVLAGKIDDPENPYAGGRFEVAEGAPGDGLTLGFVDPVVLDLPKREYSPGEAVVIRWKPYPGATEYAVQLWEQVGPEVYRGSHGVFSWPERPVVREPALDLADYGIQLKAGHYYRVDVTARDDAGRRLSERSRIFHNYDFKVVAPGEGGG